MDIPPVDYPTTAVPTRRSGTPVFTNEKLMTIPLKCNFGKTLYPFETCGFRNDEADDFDWQSGIYDTPTQRTGPPAFAYGSQGLEPCPL